MGQFRLPTWFRLPNRKLLIPLGFIAILLLITIISSIGLVRSTLFKTKSRAYSPSIYISPSVIPPSYGAQSVVMGNLDQLGCNIMKGWACDSSDFSKPLRLTFMVDFDANRFTLDSYMPTPPVAGTYFSDWRITQFCGGNVFHGFNFPVPSILKDGKKHVVQVSAYNLANTGKQDIGSAVLGPCVASPAGAGTNPSPVMYASPTIKPPTLTPTKRPTPTPTPKKKFWWSR